MQVAVQALTASGVILMRYLHGKTTNDVRLKGRNDLVTSADLASCKVIKKQLKQVFAGHSFLFEEAEFSEDNGSEFLWIVDPLDGTTFHNRGLPFFSNILALEVSGQIELGLSYSPFTGEMFLAQLGRGVKHCNQRRRFRKQLRVSSVRDLNSALIGYSYGKSKAHARQMAACFSALLPKCRAVTRLGGVEIGYVASGACEAFIDNSSTPWDFAAFALMVREAGGRATDFLGKGWNSQSNSIVVSNGLLHDDVLSLIKRVGPKI